MTDGRCEQGENLQGVQFARQVYQPGQAVHLVTDKHNPYIVKPVLLGVGLRKIQANEGRKEEEREVGEEGGW